MTEVTFEGEPVGGATVDVWQDAAGTPCWSARMLMPLGDIASVGHLACPQRNLPLLGEFAGVAQEVEQDLPQPHGINGQGA